MLGRGPLDCRPGQTQLYLIRVFPTEVSSITKVHRMLTKPFGGFIFFFTKEIGDAQVWVPKPGRLWLPQIKQGVSGQSPQGLWGPTSSSTLRAASPTSTPSPPWPFPLSLHSPIRREGCPQGVLISLTHGSQLYWA